MSDTNPDPKTSIQVIERMMRLLDALAAHSDPVSLKELAIRTELHPSTAHRILNDMVMCRLVDRSDPGTYRLGMRLLELGNLVKARLSVRDAALTPMRELHRQTGQTVNLSVRQGDEIVYIERAYSERSGMQVVRAIGGRAPLHLTSVGKLFLAADESTRVRAYATRTGLSGHTQNSITDLTKLERELSHVRQQACARDNEELELGVRCIAAGIYDDTGKLVAGLSLSAPADRLQDSWLGQLSQTALMISEVARLSAASTARPFAQSPRVTRAPLLPRRNKKASHSRGFFSTAGPETGRSNTYASGARAARVRAGNARLIAAVIQPRAQTRGVRETRVLARRIEQHHDHRTAVNGRLHHEALARFVDETGLLQTDVPRRVAHQRIGAVVRELSACRCTPHSCDRSRTGGSPDTGTPR